MCLSACQYPVVYQSVFQPATVKLPTGIQKKVSWIHTTCQNPSQLPRILKTAEFRDRAL